jgi:catalase-peroxidase
MDAKTDDKTAGKCPFTGARGPTNRHWWPDQLDIQVLHYMGWP